MSCLNAHLTINPLNCNKYYICNLFCMIVAHYQNKALYNKGYPIQILRINTSTGSFFVRLLACIYPWADRRFFPVLFRLKRAWKYLSVRITSVKIWSSRTHLFCHPFEMFLKFLRKAIYFCSNMTSYYIIFSQ